MRPGSQAGKPDVAAVKFAHSYCEAAHRLLDDISLAPRLRYCEKVEGFAEKLRTAVRTLHDANFVHGDLQVPNILVTEDGGMKVTDLDWCGRDGEVRYPSNINMNKRVGWDPDVTRGGLVKKGHDRPMCSRLTG